MKVAGLGEIFTPMICNAGKLLGQLLTVKRETFVEENFHEFCSL